MTLQNSTTAVKHALLAASIGKDRAEALRRIKNDIIGHQQKKLEIVQDEQVISYILRILEEGSSDEQLQAAYIIGSLAHGMFCLISSFTKALIS